VTGAQRERGGEAGGAGGVRRQLRLIHKNAPEAVGALERLHPRCELHETVHEVFDVIALA